MKASDWRTASSSSTICTTKLSDIGCRLYPGRLQSKSEQGATARIGFGPKLTPVRLDNAARNRKSDAHAGGFRGDKGLEQFCRDLLVDTATGIRDADLDHAALSTPGLHHKLLPLGALHRFDCVANEIEQDLLNLHFLDEDRRNVGIPVEDGP